MGNAKSKENRLKTKWKAPGLLILIRNPKRCPELALFGQTLSKKCSICYATINICDGDLKESHLKIKHKEPKLECLPSNVLYKSIKSKSLSAGIQSLLQSFKTECFRLNALVVGYQISWYPQNRNIIDGYMDLLNDTTNGLIICRGFRRINWFATTFIPPPISTDSNTYYDMIVKQYPRPPFSPILDAYALSPQIIDVWWILNDNLCLLIPYIMSIDSFWKHCKLRLRMIANINLNCIENTNELISGFIREFENEMKMERIIPRSIIFVICEFYQKETDIKTDILNVKEIISKFNLRYSEPEVFTANQMPQRKTIEIFEKLSQRKLDVEQSSIIKKWLVISEVLCVYSRYSAVNVISIPILKNDMDAITYMSLLYMLSDQTKLPPTAMIRGNDESNKCVR